MAIGKGSIIHVLRGVPLDPTSQNTLYFGSKSAQTAYFQSKIKDTMISASYQREEAGIYMNKTADEFDDCSYVMYNNTTYHDKWFYAYITSVEYKSDTSCIIHIQTDNIQTWFFDGTLRSCFVEREHSAIDTIGSNLVPEGLDVGDYVFDYDDTGRELWGGSIIIVACTFGADLEPASGGYYAGTYSGVNLLAFANATDANTFLDEVTIANKSDGIVSIFMMPVLLFNPFPNPAPVINNVQVPKSGSIIDGYTPKNKKLFTYPYNMLYVTNGEGVSANFKMEYFTSNTCDFKMYATTSINPEVALVPYNYNGVIENINEKLITSNFPLCAYNIDSFKAYIAQNSNRIVSDVAMGVVNTIAGAGQAYISGGLVGGGSMASGIGGVLNTVASIEDKRTLPPQAKGSQSSNINFAMGQKGFHFYRCHVRYEFARIIDEFFTMYGYATHRVKVPNVSARPRWNYVKTNDCVFSGNIPIQAREDIQKAFNQGITFWKNGSEVGDYTLDNNV